MENLIGNRKKIKVLFLTHSFIRKKGDSAGAFLFDLAQGFIKQGIEVTVVAPHENKLPTFECIDDLYIYRFRYAPYRYERLAYKGIMHKLARGNLSNRILIILFLISFLFKAYEIIIKRKIDIIHAHWWIPSGMVAFSLSALTNKPYIVTTHGTDITLLNNNSLLRILAKLTFKKSSYITSVASPHKSILSNQIGIDESKVDVLPMPVDPLLFYPQETKKPEGNIILSIGRLVKAKGFEYLIDAVNLLKFKGKRFHLMIIGDGPDKQLLQNKIKEHGLNNNIEIIPSMPRYKLNKFYNLCDIFVLPSLSEGVSVAVLEALACKNAVITTPVGGMCDIVIDNQTGLIVPQKNTSALANAIEKLLNDRKLALRLAENGYRLVKENFTPLKSAKRMQNIYCKVLS